MTTCIPDYIKINSNLNVLLKNVDVFIFVN